MPATLIAVDDSVTMRKVLQMTFAGEDFRVVTADNADAALALIKAENPALVLADVTLPGKSGYDLCAEIKRQNPTLPVVLLSSKLNPYDKTRGQNAKADDHMDKPFDTQKLIEKVLSLVSGEKGLPVVQGTPKAAAEPYRAPANMQTTLTGQGPLKPLPTKSAAAPRQAVSLRTTADMTARPLAGSLSARAPIPPTSASPAPPIVQAKPVAPRAPVAPIATAKPTKTASTKPIPQVPRVKSDDDLSAKLKGLGLTKEQVEGVLLLSQDLVERVVWEVVPVLAETIIKEEIKRLTEDA